MEEIEIEKYLRFNTDYNVDKVDEEENPEGDYMFEEIISLLQQIVEDRTVPRNIRASCEECINALKNGKEAESIRINTAISILDEVTNDPNIPMYTRTQIWNIVSLLEAAQK